MKTVLITGAGRGIGLATARALAAAGWRVLALDKEFGADTVGERIAFDLAHTAQIPALIASLGDVDTLVNTPACCIAIRSTPFRMRIDPRSWSLTSRHRPRSSRRWRRA